MFAGWAFNRPFRTNVNEGYGLLVGIFSNVFHRVWDILVKSLSCGTRFLETNRRSAGWTCKSAQVANGSKFRHVAGHPQDSEQREQGSTGDAHDFAHHLANLNK